VNQLDDDASKENPVIDEFPYVFLDDLLGMPPDRGIAVSINAVSKSTSLATVFRSPQAPFPSNSCFEVLIS
jgi:hypothetical protein